MIQLNYRDTRPIYEQVKQSIKQMVYNNLLAADEKLPSVRELASHLAINPNTISRAYKELEQEGFLYTQSGIGTFVNPDFKVLENQTIELYQEFDEITKKLLAIAVTPEELNKRIEILVKGGDLDDSGK